MTKKEFFVCRCYTIIDKWYRDNIGKEVEYLNTKDLKEQISKEFKKRKGR